MFRFTPSFWPLGLDIPEVLFEQLIFYICIFLCLKGVMCCLYPVNTVPYQRTTELLTSTDYEIQNWETVLRKDGEQSSVPASSDSPQYVER